MTQVRTTVDRVIDEINSGILRGRYVPEQRLVTTEFMERMGISLSPIREAFHVLAGEGVLEIVPNRGARVRRLSIDDMINGFEILSVIGPLALRKLTPSIKKAKLKKDLRTYWATIQKAIEERDALRLFSAVSDSHRYVNGLSGNPYLGDVVDRLHLEIFYRQVSEYIPGKHWDRFRRNYERCFDSLENERVVQAEKYLAKHYKWCMSLLEKEKARGAE